MVLRLGKVTFNPGQRTSMLYFVNANTNERLSGSFTVVGSNFLTTTMPFHFYEGKMPFEENHHKLTDTVSPLREHGLLKDFKLASFQSLKRLQRHKVIRADLNIDKYGDYGVVRVNSELCCFVPLIEINGKGVFYVEEITHPNGITTVDVLFRGKDVR